MYMIYFYNSGLFEVDLLLLSKLFVLLGFLLSLDFLFRFRLVMLCCSLFQTHCEKPVFLPTRW